MNIPKKKRVNLVKRNEVSGGVTPHSMRAVSSLCSFHEKHQPLPKRKVGHRQVGKFSPPSIMNTSTDHSSKSDMGTGHLPQKNRVRRLAAVNFQPIKTQAEAGNPEAQHELGWMYENGEGVEQNCVEAACWYQKAAEEGFAQAQVKLGWIYRNGRGIERDLSKSEHWYRRGAQQYRGEAEKGDVMAQLALGWMYESGEAVERDYVQAVKWYRKAAEQGFPKAQFDLGGMFYGGYGVEQDFAEAYKWFWLSGADGWERYADHMTPEQIAEGKMRADAFHQHLKDLAEMKRNSIEQLPLCERFDLSSPPLEELQLFHIAQTKFNKRKKMKTTVMVALAGTLLVTLFVAWSFNSSPERAAYEKAKTVIDKQYQTHVLSIYGKGTAKNVETWYVNFFDPDSPSKGRVVVVQDGAVLRSNAADGKRSHDDGRSFDPVLSKVTAATAMKTAKVYAEQNQITYDATTVLLRRLEMGKAPVWRVDLRKDGSSQGFVFAKSEDGSLASYDPPPKKGATAEDFGNNVANTFKGIGADLEEFFTGERTVDK